MGNQRIEWKKATTLTLVFLAIWWMPVDSARFQQGITGALNLTKWYAREHVVFCLLPAFFIAGAIASLINQGSVMKYLGAKAKRTAAYGVASISGTILAVCSCTVLPLFAGIHRMGAGLGPATTFLYAGPAISVLAIVMSTKVLGVELGLARGIAAVIFSIVIGSLMATLFRKSESDRSATQAQLPPTDDTRPTHHSATLIALLVLLLILANWAPSDHPFFASIFSIKWWGVATCGAGLALTLAAWFGASKARLGISAAVVIAAAVAAPDQPLIAFSCALGALVWITAGQPDQLGDWWRQTWSFTKQVTPLLLGGVFIAGLLLGTPESEGWIPSEWVASLVGGDGTLPILGAALAGSLMYFATLTEIPIVEGLQSAGMSPGAALALLLAGPALSLPNMLVIRSVIGTTKTLTYVALVVAFSTLAGCLAAPIL
ncbi:permease [Sulfuriroseicoccus oceanibius]|uniref:Permease n=1 Tax=Sulfuriroseicoccus oceanibius TaxID=2707525 RepID=A0A6B3L6F1_9BACT|nr:permease [Sulfuriroseicoccus oceanibius]QQL46176.1 permease [Sulfuriroseicoccus oceanibius]